MSSDCELEIMVVGWESRMGGIEAGGELGCQVGCRGWTFIPGKVRVRIKSKVASEEALI